MSCQRDRSPNGGRRRTYGRSRRPRGFVVDRVHPVHALRGLLLKSILHQWLPFPSRNTLERIRILKRREMGKRERTLIKIRRKSTNYFFQPNRRPPNYPLAAPENKTELVVFANERSLILRILKTYAEEDARYEPK